MAILDTGADTTVLPFELVSLLGFSTSNLESINTNAVGGRTRTWRVKGDPGVEINIGGQWLKVPRLVFAERMPPLLGRDVIFTHFELRMTMGETELRPRFKK